ncbi:MAG: sarcosine oxidase subunit delta [Steroidobacteraceae bacterium]
MMAALPVFPVESARQHTERCWHSFVCGQWFNVLRDTVMHTIVASYRMEGPRPTAG